MTTTAPTTAPAQGPEISTGRIQDAGHVAIISDGNDERE